MTDTPDNGQSLYCLHELSGDDVYPAPARATAQRWAAEWTVFWHLRNPTPHEYDPMMTWRVSPWPWDAQSHADGLAKSIEGNTFTPSPLEALNANALSKLVEALRVALRRLMVAAEADMNSDNPEGIDGSEINAANQAILDSYPTVFDAEQVAKITAWQECGHVHPLTCPNQPHGYHDEDGTPLADALFAHPNGMFCPHCEYRQDWAPDVCLGPLPELPEGFAALANITPMTAKYDRKEAL